MRNSKNAGFLLSIIAVAAVVAVAVYMFLMRPALDATAESKAAAEAASAFNDTLEIQLVQYQADFEKLPETQEKIALIQEGFAPQEDVAEIRRQIDELLTAEGLVVKSDSVTGPLLSLPGSQFLQPAAAAVGRTSYTDGLTYTDLYVTSFELEFLGSFDSVIRAIARLQMNEGRYFLVSAIDAAQIEGSPGTYNAKITVQVFTLVDPTGTIDPGTNSANVDPITGEEEPITEPGSALSGAPVPAPAPTTSPSPSPSPSEEGTE